MKPSQFLRSPILSKCQVLNFEFRALFSGLIAQIPTPADKSKPRIRGKSRLILKDMEAFINYIFLPQAGSQSWFAAKQNGLRMKHSSLHFYSLQEKLPSLLFGHKHMDSLRVCAGIILSLLWSSPSMPIWWWPFQLLWWSAGSMHFTLPLRDPPPPGMGG